MGGHLVCLRNKEEVGRAEGKSQGGHERREVKEGWMDRWTAREWGGAGSRDVLENSSPKGGPYLLATAQTY